MFQIPQFQYWDCSQKLIPLILILSSYQLTTSFFEFAIEWNKVTSYLGKEIKNLPQIDIWIICSAVTIIGIIGSFEKWI